MPTWTDGWAFREDGEVCNPARARAKLEYILSHRDLLQFYDTMLDELSEMCNLPTFTLTKLGYMKCRDEIIGTPVFDEIDSETQLYLLYMDMADIDTYIGSYLDGVMCEYDEAQGIAENERR
ncbi:hypothetical protein ACRU44_12640 [Mycobacterium colombiense]